MNPKIDHQVPFEKREYTSGYTFQLAFLSPRYWLIWMVILLLLVIGRLPFTWILALGRVIGRILLQIGGTRVNVTRRNLELCFPEKSAGQHEQLLKQNFEAIGIALLEPGVAWFSSKKRIQRLTNVIGLDNITSLQHRGQGVLISCQHMTCIEIACRAISEHTSLNILYRVHDNPVYEYISGKMRHSYTHKARFIPRKQVKDLLYFMKRGEMGIILADQDMGRGRSLFVPFFGIDAATVTSVSDFSRLAGVQVVIGTFWLDTDNRYKIMLSTPLENFPTDDNFKDTTRINTLTEDVIRQHPEQYLWQHRRFKTRPKGEESLYGKKEKKRKRKRKRKE